MHPRLPILSAFCGQKCLGLALLGASLAVLSKRPHPFAGDEMKAVLVAMVKSLGLGAKQFEHASS